MRKIYPKNKKYFKELIPFAKKIITICEKNKASPMIYGSFAHFYFTKDEKIKVNDIDIIIKKKYISKIAEVLKKEGIKNNYYPEHNMIIAKKGELKVEIDEIGDSYETLNDNNFLRVSRPIDFYGKQVKMITLNHLKEMYPVAFVEANKTKKKVERRIKHLERFLKEDIMKK